MASDNLREEARDLMRHNRRMAESLLLQTSRGGPSALLDATRAAAHASLALFYQGLSR